MLNAYLFDWLPRINSKEFEVALRTELSDDLEEAQGFSWLLVTYEPHLDAIGIPTKKGMGKEHCELLGVPAAKLLNSEFRFPKRGVLTFGIAGGEAKGAI